MIKVQLIDNPQQHNFVYTNAQKATMECDCIGDCACPIEGPAFPNLDHPIYYALELTPSCNNHCPGCSNVFERTPPPLPLTQWRAILNIIAPHAVHLKLTGGEPTLHPDFTYILTEIEQHEIPYTLFTNARWVDPQYIINTLKASANCTGVLISLHGATPASHEAFTGVPGSFAEAVTNIRRATKNGVSVHISCVLTRYNLDQIVDVITLSKNIGASATVFNRYIGTPIDDLSLTPAQLTQAVVQIDSLQRDSEPVRFGTCIPQCFTLSTSTGCLAGSAYCTLDPWGNLRPCNHTPWIAGNILTGSLKSAWRSEVMQRWRGLLSLSCTTCAAFSQCRGGCRAEALLNGVAHDPLMHAPLTSPEVKASTTLHLYRHATVTFTCKVQPQSFGYLLNKSYQSLPVTKTLTPILAASQTGDTLETIRDTSGQPALDMIGKLYQQGFIALNW